jgi:hypothetical protein
MADFEVFAGDDNITRSGRLWTKIAGEKTYLDLSLATVIGHVFDSDENIVITLTGVPAADQTVDTGLFSFVFSPADALPVGLYNLEWQVTIGSYQETWAGDTVLVSRRRFP